MRVLFPIGSYYPAQIGGPGNTIYWLAKALCYSGNEVTVTTTDHQLPEIEKNKWLQTDHGRVIYCKTKILNLPFNLILRTLREIKKTEIIHLNSLFYPLSIISAIYGIIAKKQIVWSPRGELYTFAMNSRKSVLKRIILAIIRVFISKKVTFHATNSEESILIKSTFGNKTKLFELPNYIILPQKLERNIEAKTLLFLGRLHPIKGLENLIGALSKSEKFISSNFTLQIAGTGKDDYISALRLLINKHQLNEKIQLLGFVEGSTKETLLCNAYFLILPSHSENFGNVVIEALAQGTPVIASKGTPWQILEETNTGYWLDNDEDSLQKGIDKIISLSNENYEKIRKNAFELAKDQFDVYKNIDKWLDTYSHLGHS